jgi:hypothetical protein
MRVADVVTNHGNAFALPLKLLDFCGIAVRNDSLVAHCRTLSSGMQLTIPLPRLVQPQLEFVPGLHVLSTRSKSPE